MAKERFQGKLMADALAITEKTTVDEINEKTSFEGIQLRGETRHLNRNNDETRSYPV